MIVFKPPPPKMQHTQSEGVSEGGRGRERKREGGRGGRVGERKGGKEKKRGEGGREGGRRDIQYMHTHLHHTQICTHSKTLTGE